MPALLEILKHIVPLIASSIAKKYFDNKHQEEIKKHREEIDRLRQEVARMVKLKVNKRTREGYIRKIGDNARAIGKLRSSGAKDL